MKNNYKIIGDYVIIYLNGRKNKGFETMIDLEDFEKIKNLNFSWHVSWKGCINNYYATATIYLGTINNKPKYKTIYLHRVILGVEDRNMIVDHIEQDNTLDNRKKNLRTTEQNKNLKHRNGKNKNNSSGYRNVSWVSSKEKWIIQLQIEGKNKSFGYFDDIHEAGKLAEELRNKYYGEYKGK